MSLRFHWIAIGLLLTAACGSDQAASTADPQTAAAQPAGPDPAPGYVVLDDDLTGLIADFNAHAGKIRQIYIVGPTCGICLRGMADMDRALVAAAQDDPRLHTQVLHVPALGAEQRHVEPTIHLLDGPRVRHFWDGSGHSGLEFQDTLGLPMYAWDVWLIYGPEAVWEPGNAPPAPEFWQHQLGGVRDEVASKLDPEVFAAEVRLRMNQIDPASVPDSARPVPPSDTVAGQVIRVEQPRGFVIQQHLVTRGGYRSLKKITSITTRGHLIVGEREFPMSSVSERDGRYQRTVETPDGTAATVVEDGTVRHQGPPLIPPAVDDAVLAAFEFGGWLLEWKDKGHRVWRLGMVQEAGRLPWLMEVEHRNGQTWRLYLDSHSGDDYRKVLLDQQGNPSVTLEFADFRDVAGYRVPHSWVLSTAGETIARARHEDVRIDVSEDAADIATSH